MPIFTCNDIKAYDFYTFYTIIPIKRIISTAFHEKKKKRKEGQRRYKYHVLGRNKSNIVQNHYDSNKLFFLLNWHHICYVWWKRFLADSRYSYEYQLWYYSRQRYS